MCLSRGRATVALHEVHRLGGRDPLDLIFGKVAGDRRPQFDSQSRLAPRHLAARAPLLRIVFFQVLDHLTHHAFCLLAFYADVFDYFDDVATRYADRKWSARARRQRQQRG